MLVIRRGGHSIKHAETLQAPWYTNSHYLCFGTHYSRATVSVNKPYCHSSCFQMLRPNNLNCKDFVFSTAGNHLDCEGMCVGTTRSKINSVLPDTLWLLAASEEKLRKQPTGKREKFQSVCGGGKKSAPLRLFFLGNTWMDAAIIILWLLRGAGVRRGSGSSPREQEQNRGKQRQAAGY